MELKIYPCPDIKLRRLGHHMGLKGDRRKYRPFKASQDPPLNLLLVRYYHQPPVPIQQVTFLRDLLRYPRTLLSQHNLYPLWERSKVQAKYYQPNYRL